MAAVVKVHLNGHTYTHATATDTNDPSLQTLWAALRAEQTQWPQDALSIPVRTDAGPTTLLWVYPQRVWAFASWVGDSAGNSLITFGTTLGL